LLQWHFSVAVAGFIIALTTQEAKGMNEDQIVLCVTDLNTKFENDLNCKIFQMDDVKMRNDNFVKNLFHIRMADGLDKNFQYNLHTH
jgi:hypothetical protein